MSITDRPLGATSRMSRSSGKVWLKLLKVAVTLYTAEVRPETMIVEGYGTAGALKMSSMVMAVGLANERVTLTQVLVKTAVLLARFSSVWAAEILAALTIVPGIDARATMVTVALLPEARLPRPQVMRPPVLVQLPCVAE